MSWWWRKVPYGVSAWQFLLPACFGALLFGLATIFILNPLCRTRIFQSRRDCGNVENRQGNGCLGLA